jgi:hypothetical protein
MANFILQLASQSDTFLRSNLDICVYFDKKKFNLTKISEKFEGF